MVNEVNVKGRLRYPIRGRVLGFTTSRTIDFLEDSKKCSITLYSRESAYNDALYGVSFMLELNGSLTFDADAQVKLIDLAPYERGLYDPTLFSVVRVTDPFVSRILEVGGVAGGGSNPYGWTVGLRVSLPYAGGSEWQYVSNTAALPHVFNAFGSLVYKTFKVGDEWLGTEAYPGFSKAY